MLVLCFESQVDTKSLVASYHSGTSRSVTKCHHNFTISGRIQERKSIIGKEQDFIQPEAERVRSYDPELVGPSKRSIKKQQTVVNTSNEASSPRIRNDISTQIKHNVLIPESTISSNTQ
ncbi:hypothetical protein O181_033300 [Austropuccinia psidii MF-1]|uniref:Uncharacterized protein n=1 Tax=Austropuccinia psidii MF-1 TaxID=1389203 RepID=A0A9Q3H941_9BASI|nr:hypothetical protein [Austropuccinia psidii MF-1]